MPRPISISVTGAAYRAHERPLPGAGGAAVVTPRVARAAAGERTEDAEVLRHYHDSLHGPEYAEGVQAFLAKRAPDFRAARNG